MDFNCRKLFPVSVVRYQESTSNWGNCCFCFCFSFSFSLTHGNLPLISLICFSTCFICFSEECFSLLPHTKQSFYRFCFQKWLVFTHKPIKKNCTGIVKQARKSLFKTIVKGSEIDLNSAATKDSFKCWGELSTKYWLEKY